MVEFKTKDNIFVLPSGRTEAVIIPTNGAIRRNGDGVMGRGMALEAKRMFSGIEQKLGKYLRRYGNRVFNMGCYRNEYREMTVVTFPTKHHFRYPSDLYLIELSATQLVQIADKFRLSKVYMPPVGCGCGSLDYEEQVKPILQKILNDDRFVVVLRSRYL